MVESTTDTDLTERLAEPAATAHTAADRACHVLLGSLLGQIGGSCGAILRGTVAGALAPVAVRDRAGRPFADTSPPGAEAFRFALEGPAAVVVSDPHRPSSNGNGALEESILAPIRGPRGLLGLVWAGFEERVEGDKEFACWQVDSYARAAAACLVGGRELSVALGSRGIDELTGCLDLGGLHEALAVEIERSRRLGSDLACGFLDLDGFKRVNDREGHLVGNQVLAAIGATLRGGVRAYDIVARFGGDEFVLLLPDTELGKAQVILERLGQEVTVASQPTTSIPLGVSVGTAIHEAGGSAQDLLAAADIQLRRAKARLGAAR